MLKSVLFLQVYS